MYLHGDLDSQKVDPRFHTLRCYQYYLPRIVFRRIAVNCTVIRRVGHRIIPHSQRFHRTVH
jgi:hypothetical protein